MKIIIVYEKEKQNKICSFVERETIPTEFLNMKLAIDHYEKLLRILQFKSIMDSTHILWICK